MEVFFLFSVFLSFLCLVFCDQCKYPKHSSQNEKAMNLLKPLVGKRYSIDTEDGLYVYHAGICVDAFDGSTFDNAGVVQTIKKDNGQSNADQNIVVGRLDTAEIMAGTDWILLEYGGGKQYNSHCGKTKRKASIMITCDPTETEGKFTVLEENLNKTSECYYLFELSHSAICVSGSNNGLSFGSIFCIVLFIVIFLYLTGGFIYQRLVIGAKGYEQIPNYSFWKDFGNLQADGCDFLCRTSSRNEPRSYKGIGDDQLIDDEDDKDDHLLPM